MISDGESEPGARERPNSLNRALRLAFLCILVAGLLEWCQYGLVRWLVALVCVLGARILAQRVDVRRHPAHSGGSRICMGAVLPSPGASAKLTDSSKQNRQQRDRDAWRKLVGSEAVAAAWDKLCNSVIQEFIYDAWFSQMSPDREFPAEVRWQLNHAFGQASMRAKRLDWTSLLVRDCSAVLCSTLQLYRTAVDVVGSDKFKALPPEEADAAIRTALSASHSLHPAFNRPDGQYRVCKRLAEAVLAHILPAEDRACPMMRSMLRELFATCILRSTLASLAPYSVNKLLLNVLAGAANPQPVSKEMVNAAAEFERRGHQSSKAEVEHISLQRAERKASRRSVLGAGNTAQQATEEGGASSTASMKRSKSLGDVKNATDIPPMTAAASAAAGPARTAVSLTTKPTTGKWKDGVSPGKGGFAAVPGYQQGQQALMGGVGAVKAAAQQLALRKRIGSDTRPAGARASLIAAFGSSPPSSIGADSPRSWSAMELASSTYPFCHKETAAANRAISAGGAAMGCTGGLAWPDSKNSSQPVRSQGGTCSSGGSRPPMVAVLCGLGPKGGALPISPTASAAGVQLHGRPRAQVATAELLSLDGKECIVYKVLVRDNRGEWTVTRRYRHFEALHKRLKDCPHYRDLPAALPPKRLLTTRDATFVRKRRDELDSYLQGLLASPFLAANQELHQFLSQQSEVYSMAAAADDEQGIRGMHEQLGGQQEQMWQQTESPHSSASTSHSQHLQQQEQEQQEQQQQQQQQQQQKLQLLSCQAVADRCICSSAVGSGSPGVHAGCAATKGLAAVAAAAAVANPPGLMRRLPSGSGIQGSWDSASSMGPPGGLLADAGKRTFGMAKEISCSAGAAAAAWHDYGESSQQQQQWQPRDWEQLLQHHKQPRHDMLAASGHDRIPCRLGQQQQQQQQHQDSTVALQQAAALQVQQKQLAVPAITISKATVQEAVEVRPSVYAAPGSNSGQSEYCNSCSAPARGTGTAHLGTGSNIAAVTPAVAQGEDNPSSTGHSITSHSGSGSTSTAGGQEQQQQPVTAQASKHSSNEQQQQQQQQQTITPLLSTWQRQQEQEQEQQRQQQAEHWSPVPQLVLQQPMLRQQLQLHLSLEQLDSVDPDFVAQQAAAVPVLPISPPVPNKILPVPSVALDSMSSCRSRGGARQLSREDSEAAHQIGGRPEQLHVLPLSDCTHGCQWPGSANESVSKESYCILASGAAGSSSVGTAAIMAIHSNTAGSSGSNHSSSGLSPAERQLQAGKLAAGGSSDTIDMQNLHKGSSNQAGFADVAPGPLTQGLQQQLLQQAAASTMQRHNFQHRQRQQPVCAVSSMSAAAGPAGLQAAATYSITPRVAAAAGSAANAGGDASCEERRSSGAAAAAAAAVAAAGLDPAAEAACSSAQQFDDVMEWQDGIPDNTGLIEPLYELVSCVFELETKGFVRRPVITLVRQLLSLIAGDAIDDFLQKLLANGLSEDNISRQLQRVQAQLWPGGVWFARAAAAHAAAAGAAGASNGSSTAGSTGAGSVPPRGPPISAERYLDWVPPADCGEVAERLRQKLFGSNVPAPLLALLGKSCYYKSIGDIYGVLQSKTLMYHLGLSVMETVLVAMFPEIRGTVRQIRLGAL